MFALKKKKLFIDFLCTCIVNEHRAFDTETLQLSSSLTEEGFFTPTGNRKEISHGIENSLADVQNLLIYSLSLACSPFEWRRKSLVQQGVNLPLRHLSSLQTIQEDCQGVE